MEQAPRRQRKNGRGERRKPPPSPTWCAGTELTKPAASPPPRAPGWTEPPPPATGDGSWLILDRFVHLSRRRRGVVEGDATASSLTEDCAGRPVRASLRIAGPPAVSRLYLHWAWRPQIRGFAEPAAIAAHRNSILFRMSVPFEDSTCWIDISSSPLDYLLFQPYRCEQQRIMFDEDMGILCHGDNGEFTVADLTYRYRQEVDLCLLHHPPPAGIPLKWSINRLQIPPQMKIDLYSWRTDVVVPIDRSLCWVDYYQGILLIDVLADSQSSPIQQQLHYVRLPSQALKSRRLYIDPGAPDPFRRVCITDAGIIKLVCILTKYPPPDDEFTIITWTLVDINQGSWRKDVDTISCLPRVRPSFPVVSLVDPDVICFLLKEKDRNVSWMVEVNMRKKVLLSSALYINEEEEEGPPSEKDRRNNFFGHSFIPTKFSSYLAEDAITSRKLSETMQKDKEERMM
ncbi:hypothetical protein SETIT_8G246200v2 [Setaria italica]|uniref:DUF1618 domain-containing protein n=1 Tax=Setaria italica TaxID=4555 RepID=A0A368SBB0_SETIT|nr:hypothetical protein SETIT_8G246200v2 [Setaria italica]